ncbi:MAG: DUF167 domain-containing protein [Candidatus Omnitrophica bacterium]|nr:DUF167 domain-containing protein [Candidatus Omnitrophota bacterium]
MEVRVTPKASRPGIEPSSDGPWRVRVHEPAEGGRANAAVIRALAGYFQVPPSSVVIVRGAAGRIKLIELRA